MEERKEEKQAKRFGLKTVIVTAACAAYVVYDGTHDWKLAKTVVKTVCKAGKSVIGHITGKKCETAPEVVTEINYAPKEIVNYRQDRPGKYQH